MKNIVLIGMPGAGKSTVGVLLAKTLGMVFIDTDLEIQAREKRLLSKIIEGDGLEGFLKIEEQTALSCFPINAVIATGGSMVYSAKAMHHLKEKAVTCYLKLDYKTLEGRIRNITTRGIVMKPHQTLEGIYMERLLLYEAYADITIDCIGLNTEDLVGAIVKIINEYK